MNEPTTDNVFSDADGQALLEFRLATGLVASYFRAAALAIEQTILIVDELGGPQNDLERRNMKARAAQVERLRDTANGITNTGDSPAFRRLAIAATNQWREQRNALGLVKGDEARQESLAHQSGPGV